MISMSADRRYEFLDSRGRILNQVFRFAGSALLRLRFPIHYRLLSERDSSSLTLAGYDPIVTESDFLVKCFR
jgi:hypothetical protein